MNNINEYLSHFKNKVIYYKPNPGNGGDALIALGAIHLFNSNNLKYKLLKRNEQIENDKILFYAGGGNLVNDYTDCSSFLEKHHSKAEKIVLLPHTVQGHNDTLKKLGDNVDIICREKQSFEYVSTFKNLGNVYLMEDLAFSLPTKSILKLSKWKKTNLIAVLKLYIKKIIKSKKLNFKVLNAYRTDVERTNVKIPKDNLDLSTWINYSPKMDEIDKIENTVSDIFKFVNLFNTINTNRLHIAITGALLGKKVNFYSNSYYKNQAVYLQSMKNKFPNVNWIE